MQRVLGMKSVVAIVVACFLLSVGITTAQTQSIPLEQKTPVIPFHFKVDTNGQQGKHS